MRPPSAGGFIVTSGLNRQREVAHPVFDDPERVRLALTGRTTPSPFFVTRDLKPADLFQGAMRQTGTEPRTTFTVGNQDDRTEDHIIALYDEPGTPAG